MTLPRNLPLSGEDDVPFAWGSAKLEDHLSVLVRLQIDLFSTGDDEVSRRGDRHEDMGDSFGSGGVDLIRDRIAYVLGDGLVIDAFDEEDGDSIFGCYEGPPRAARARSTFWGE